LLGTKWFPALVPEVVGITHQSNEGRVRRVACEMGHQLSPHFWILSSGPRQRAREKSKTGTKAAVGVPDGRGCYQGGEDPGAMALRGEEQHMGTLFAMAPWFLVSQSTWLHHIWRDRR
jgi:hypothetical protein